MTPFRRIPKTFVQVIALQRIGLVLSGGLAKGAYQLGVLKAVDELVDFDSITAISASSVGALNAYAFVNHRLETAEQVWRSLNCKGMKDFIRNVLQSDFLDRQIKRFAVPQRVESKKFYTTLLNTKEKNIDYINLCAIEPNLVQKFIRASVALPPFNQPMQILDTAYLDGALADNIPISPLVKENLDCIICIYFDDYNYSFENRTIDEKTVKINQQSSMFMKNVFLFRHEYIEQMIDDGYQYGRGVLCEFFENGQLIPTYKTRIDDFNRQNENLKWYVTCEVLTKRLNKVTQKYLKEKRQK